MTDPVPSSLLRQEGPQQEEMDFCDLAVGDVFRFRHQPDEGPYVKRGLREYVTTVPPTMKRVGTKTAPVTRMAALSAPKPDPDLLARLRDYHDQVLKGFRHISRVEEADLIQAAIDGLRQKEQK